MSHGLISDLDQFLTQPQHHDGVDEQDDQKGDGDSRSTAGHKRVEKLNGLKGIGNSDNQRNQNNRSDQKKSLGTDKETAPPCTANTASVVPGFPRERLSFAHEQSLVRLPIAIGFGQRRSPFVCYILRSALTQQSFLAAFQQNGADEVALLFQEARHDSWHIPHTIHRFEPT